MSQQELERQLAEATGEDLRTIRRRGFQLMTPLAVFDPEPDNLDTACRQAVNDELARQVPAASSASPTKSFACAGNGRSNGQSNGQENETAANGTPPPTNSHQRRATISQVRALQSIANRQQLDLTLLLSKRFQLSDPAQLTIGTASQLIDELKPVGQPERRAA